MPLLLHSLQNPNGARALGWAVCLLGAWSCSAASTASPPPSWGRPEGIHYAIETYGADRGFTQANVTAALQTEDGYLWIGTNSGLARFDGVHFTSYRMSNTPAFGSNLIHCLFEDRSGDLWIGTDRGLVRRHEDVFETVGPPGDIEVRAIVQDRAGRVWVGTYGQGLFFFSEGGLKKSDLNGTATTSPVIMSLLADSSGTLWIGREHANGLVLRDEKGSRFWDCGGAIDDWVDSLCEYPAGSVWIGTHGGQLYRWRSGTLTRFALPDPNQRSPVTGLWPARDGGLWIAADGVDKLPGRDPGPVELEHGLPRRGVIGLCEDREGGLWICAKEAGLMLARSTPYTTLSSRDGLPGDRIKTISQDPAGNLWLAMDESVATEVAADGRIVNYRGVGGFPDEVPRSLVAASDGSVWIGTPDGLGRWKDGLMTTIDGVHNVIEVYEDRAGAIWAGTATRGLYRFQDGRLQSFASEPGGNLPLATSFAEAPDGTLYIGTWRNGLAEYRNGRFERFDRQTGLPSDEVRALYVDREGYLWAGFANRGLAVRVDGRWWNPNPLSEALFDHVSAIVEDNLDRLWFGTPGGIFFAPRAELLAAARGQAPIPHMRTGEARDQSYGVAVWSGSQPIVWKSSDGRLLFATHKGVTIVNPAEVRANTVPPPVHIESVVIDQTEASPRSEVSVPAGARRVAIAYSAPSFEDSADIQYKFRLEGYDSDWIAAGSTREAVYLSLPPGSYVFRVTACNRDGVWNPQGAAIRFAVAPFFWQRTWVRLAALGAFTLAVVGIARYASFRRLRQSLRLAQQGAAVEKERARIARDIHDDVGNRLTEIILLSRLAQRPGKSPADRDAQIEQIAASARQATDSLDEIVWAVSPHRDTLRHLTAYIGEFAVDFLRTGGIACQLELPEEIPNRPVSAEIRHSLFLAVKEALHNVVRHAHATQVRLRIDVAGDRVGILVRDNGRGFTHSRDRAGSDGVQNMRQRMEEIRGDFSIEGRPGEGAEVRFEFPCPASDET